MKKAFSFLTLFVFLFGAVPNAGAASLLLHGLARVGARPVYQSAEAEFACEDIYPTNSCVDHDPHPGPFIASSTTDSNQAGAFAHIVCPPENSTCYEDYAVFFTVTWSYSWGSNQNSTAVETHLFIFHAMPYETITPCGSGMGGSCSGSVSGMIPAEDMTNDDLDAHITSIGMDQPDGLESHLEVVFSLFPIGNCEEQYSSLTSDTYIIDPIIELPLGPSGEPPDDQLYPTVSGEIYSVSVDGSWNDGTDDRDDAAISWDGETWIPLVEAPTQCKNQGENGETSDYYIIAESDTFYIRANDDAEAFADNIQGEPEFTYTIDRVAAIGVDCGSQYAYDIENDLVGFTGIDSQSEAGIQGNTYEELIAGDWYVLHWNHGTWTDSTDPTERIDLEYLMDGNWTDLTTGSAAVWCVNTATKEILFQARAENILLRANDTFGNFADNAGISYYSILHATFTRAPEACETQINIGNLVEHKTVEGDQGGGLAFASSITLTAGEWYVLDTVGGPWWNLVFSADPTYEYNMHVEEGTAGSQGEWIDLEDWTRPTCNVATDTLGHRRVVFQMPEGSDLEWRLRVADIGSFLSNAGDMSWDLYSASQYAVPPEVLSCDYSYDVGTVIDLGEVQGNNAGGEPLDGLVAGGIYAIKLIGTGYGWQEEFLGDTLYDMQISNNAGTNYYPVDEYDGVLCEQVTGIDRVIFVHPGQSYRYKLRVDSTTFENNRGKMAFVVYPATVGQSIINTCLEGWSKQIIDEFTWIDVRSEEGQLLITDNARFEEALGLVPGRTYLVETPADQGPWKTQVFDGEERWTTAISKDNAATWNGLGYENPDIDCAGYNAFGHVWFARFTIAEGDLWKIRVNDIAGEFSDNGGNMAFKLYVLCEGMSCTGSIPNDSNTNPIPAVTIIGGGDVCKIALIRPGPLTFENLVNLGTYIGNWLQYLNLSILRFMAWCPKHTNMFTAFMDGFRTKEPFATIDEWETQLKQAEQQIDSYDWGDNAHQNTSIFEINSQSEMHQWIYDHFFAEQDAVWNGGDLVSFGDGTLPAAYYSCNNAFTALLPPRLKQPVCFVTAWFIESNAAFWIQISLDIGAIFLLYSMIKGALQDAIYMMTGVKPWTKSSNRQNWVTIEKGFGNDAPATPAATRDDVADELSRRFGGSYGREGDTWRRLK